MEKNSEAVKKEVTNDTLIKKGEVTNDTVIKKEEVTNDTVIKKEDISEVKEVKMETTDPPTDLERKVIRQVEYYFGDINLARDKFLQAEIKAHGGWVSLETMLKFNRLQQLTAEEAFIAGALRKSSSGLMEVSEDGKKIRRSSPLPQVTSDTRADLKKRSIYTKSFPLDSALDDLMDFFSEFGDTEQVLMRRNSERKFKGSCFVVFKKEEAAKRFMEAESVQHGDVELEKRLYKDDYFKLKANEKTQKKEEALVAKDKLEKNEKTASQTEVVKQRMTSGAILHLSGLDPTTTREDLKKVFADFGRTVSWVDLQKGDVEGRVRFDVEGGARAALEDMSKEGKAQVKGQEVEARVLEGEEEISHWRQIFFQQKEQREKKRKNRDRPTSGRRANYKGFKKGGRGRKTEENDEESESDDEGEPSPKKVKPNPTDD